MQVPAHHVLACRIEAYDTPFADAPDLFTRAADMSEDDKRFAACLAAPPDLEEQPSMGLQRLASLLEARLTVLQQRANTEMVVQRQAETGVKFALRMRAMSGHRSGSVKADGDGDSDLDRQASRAASLVRALSGLSSRQASGVLGNLGRQASGIEGRQASGVLGDLGRQASGVGLPDDQAHGLMVTLEDASPSAPGEHHSQRISAQLNTAADAPAPVPAGVSASATNRGASARVRFAVEAPDTERVPSGPEVGACADADADAEGVDVAPGPASALRSLLSVLSVNHLSRMGREELRVALQAQCASRDGLASGAAQVLGVGALLAAAGERLLAASNALLRTASAGRMAPADELLVTHVRSFLRFRLPACDSDDDDGNAGFDMRLPRNNNSSIGI